jgi:hypothetical protein
MANTPWIFLPVRLERLIPAVLNFPRSVEPGNVAFNHIRLIGAIQFAGAIARCMLISSAMVVFTSPTITRQRY